MHDGTMRRGCQLADTEHVVFKTRDPEHHVARAVKSIVKSPIDKEIHKLSTKVVAKIFENEYDEALIEF